MKKYLITINNDKCGIEVGRYEVEADTEIEAMETAWDLFESDCSTENEEI